MENTDCGNTRNSGLKARVYFQVCHLAQISLRKVAGEHDLHCDGSLKGLATPRVEQKSSAASYCQLHVLP
jgi:hypothetical protein